MKRILSALRSLAVFAAVAPAAFGAFAQAPQPPEIAARTYMLVDVTANQVLAAKDIDAPVEQASLTKLMTGYLVFDAPGRCPVRACSSTPRCRCRLKT